jgi:hypothetical protein
MLIARTPIGRAYARLFCNILFIGGTLEIVFRLADGEYRKLWGGVVMVALAVLGSRRLQKEREEACSL